MKLRDWKIFFTGLAFVAVVGSQKKADSAEVRDEVLRLADLVEEFCKVHVPNVSAVVSDGAETVLMDEMIEKLLRELRETGSVRATADRQLLIKLHDRLQHRAARRQDRTFYGNAHEDELADAVLDYLNKELDGGVGKARPA